MSVDNVQNKFLTMAEFNNLTEAEQARYNSASKAERKQMTIEFRQANGTPSGDKVKGTAVEKSEEEVTTQEEKQTRRERRAAAKAAEEAEIARQKEAAQKLYAPQELTDFEREQISEVIGDGDKPFYKNRKAQRQLRTNIENATKEASRASQSYNDAIENAETDKQKKSIDKLYDNLAERGAKVRVKDMVIGDRVENTRVFDSRQEMRAAKRALGDEADGLRFKVHTNKTLSEENVNLHHAMENDGVSSHEAAYNMAKGISGDRTFEPNEVRTYDAMSSNVESHYNATQRELKRLGYDVKDDTLENLGKAVAVGVLSQVGTAALPATIEAFAEAMVRNSVTGDVLAYDSDSASAKYVNWKGAGIGAAVGTALAAAMFGGTQDEDVLNGINIEKIFVDGSNGERAYENVNFGSKDDTLRVKIILRAIDELDLTDEQKTQFLIEAAGENGQQILSKKELTIAYVKAYEFVHTEEVVEEVVEVEDEIVPEEPVKPEYTHEVVGATKDKTEEVAAEYGLKHVSGLYADTIVRKGYVLEDGTPITNEAHIKEIRDIIQKRNRVNELKQVPSKWMLQTEITLKDGTKVKLRPAEELLNISPELSAASDIGLRNNDEEQVVTKTVKRTENGYTYEISRKNPDAEDFEVVDRSENFYNDYESADSAAREKIEELKQQDEDAE